METFKDVALGLVVIGLCIAAIIGVVAIINAPNERGAGPTIGGGGTSDGAGADDGTVSPRGADQEREQ